MNRLDRRKQKCNEPLELHESARQAFTRRQGILIADAKWPLTRWYDDEDFYRAYNTAVQLQKKVRRLEAIIDKLPKCWQLDENGKLVQDVPVVPESEYYFVCDKTGIRHGPVQGIKFALYRPRGSWITLTVWAKPPYLQGERMVLEKQLYSTREAAEAEGEL